MANFMADLWESIFTPGPTSTLLIATNVAFGALQLVFLALLFLTYSIHFIILSFLCGGLWWGINWFAAEVRIAQAEQDEKARRDGKSTTVGEAEGDVVDDVGDDADGSGNDTEMESSLMDTPLQHEARAMPITRVAAGTVHQRQGSIPFPALNVANDAGTASDGGAAWNTGAAARLAPEGADTSRRKRRDMVDSTELSTDSEWEKVEGQ